jgi:hypothetical protein
LTTSPAVSQSRRDGFAVVPVVEYEPPTQNAAARPQSSTIALQPRTPCAPQRPYRRQSEGTPAVAAPVISPPMRQAAMFADAALRRVLEVIDRRRSVAQLRPLLAPSLVDSVLSVCRSGPTHTGAAVLRRVGLQPVAHRGPDTAAEVFGSYSRGDRIHAIACRVEQVAGSGGTPWQVVALHIG